MIVPCLVVAEAVFLIARALGPSAEARFLQSFAGGELALEHVTPADLEQAAELVCRYADLPLGTTDAAVIAVAERLDVSEIATLDRRDFSVVRPLHRHSLTLLPV